MEDGNVKNQENQQSKPKNAEEIAEERLQKKLQKFEKKFEELKKKEDLLLTNMKKEMLKKYEKLLSENFKLLADDSIYEVLETKIDAVKKELTKIETEKNQQI